VNIVGREALDERDNKVLDFAESFEEEFVSQGFHTDRTIEQTLDAAWNVLSILPENELTRVDEEYIEEYYHEEASEETDARGAEA